MARDPQATHCRRKTTLTTRSASAIGSRQKKSGQNAKHIPRLRAAPLPRRMPPAMSATSPSGITADCKRRTRPVADRSHRRKTRRSIPTAPCRHPERCQGLLERNHRRRPSHANLNSSGSWCERIRRAANVSTNIVLAGATDATTISRLYLRDGCRIGGLRAEHCRSRPSASNRGQRCRCHPSRSRGAS